MTMKTKKKKKKGLSDPTPDLQSHNLQFGKIPGHLMFEKCYIGKSWDINVKGCS